MGTITANFGFSAYSAKVEEDYNQFDKGEELITNIKQFLVITQEECDILKNNWLEDKYNENKKS